jgi:hypothetical protein
MAEIRAKHRLCRVALQLEQDIAGSAAKIENRGITHRQNRTYTRKQASSPYAINVKREQMIQQVVTGRYG